MGGVLVRVCFSHAFLSRGIFLAVFDLFKGWTPEMLEHFSLAGKRGSSWDGLSPEEYEERCRACSVGVRRYWDNLSAKGYEGRCRINSERWDKGNERGLQAERSREQWIGYTEEEKQEHLLKSFHSEESRGKLRQMHIDMTEGERQEWVGKSFHNPDARELAIERMALGIKRWWAELSEEQRDREVLKRVSASARANARGPSEPEFFLGVYLEGKYPREWAYNGNGEQNVSIGGRIPDFININGRRAVIEVLGTYHHPEEDFEGKREHYRKYGYDCFVLWHYECYFPGDIERVLRGSG